jgi:hypothetical protein
MPPADYANDPSLSFHLRLRSEKPDRHHDLNAPDGGKNRAYKFLLRYFGLVPESPEFVAFREEVTHQFLNDQFARDCSVATAPGRESLSARVNSWSVQVQKVFPLFERRVAYVKEKNISEAIGRQGTEYLSYQLVTQIRALLNSAIRRDGVQDVQKTNNGGSTCGGSAGNEDDNGVKDNNGVETDNSEMDKNDKKDDNDDDDSLYTIRRRSKGKEVERVHVSGDIGQVKGSGME